MKKELRDAWTAALRSGEYKQGKYALFPQRASYCCLGVLSVVADLDFGAIFAPNGKTYRYPSPEEGLSDGDSNTLQNLNDVKGYTFPQIADWIEQNIPVED